MCLYVRELKMDEGQKIQRILRRSTNGVKVRRAQVVLASEQGYRAPAIAELVHYSEHHVRAIIKEFNQLGLKALEPRLRSGRPAKFTEDDRAPIAETAKCPLDLLGCPFKRWSLEKLREYLVAEKIVSSISIETLRTILHERKVRLRRSKTWKECNDPALKAKKTNPQVCKQARIQWPDNIFRRVRPSGDTSSTGTNLLPYRPSETFACHLSPLRFHLIELMKLYGSSC